MCLQIAQTELSGQIAPIYVLILTMVDDAFWNANALPTKGATLQRDAYTKSMVKHFQFCFTGFTKYFKYMFIIHVFMILEYHPVLLLQDTM